MLAAAVQAEASLSLCSAAGVNTFRYQSLSPRTLDSRCVESTALHCQLDAPQDTVSCTARIRVWAAASGVLCPSAPVSLPRYHFP